MACIEFAIHSLPYIFPRMRIKRIFWVATFGLPQNKLFFSHTICFGIIILLLLRCWIYYYSFVHDLKKHPFSNISVDKLVFAYGIIHLHLLALKWFLRCVLCDSFLITFETQFQKNVISLAIISISDQLEQRSRLRSIGFPAKWNHLITHYLAWPSLTVIGAQWSLGAPLARDQWITWCNSN